MTFESSSSLSYSWLFTPSSWFTREIYGATLLLLLCLDRRFGKHSKHSSTQANTHRKSRSPNSTHFAEHRTKPPSSRRKYELTNCTFLNQWLTFSLSWLTHISLGCALLLLNQRLSRSCGSVVVPFLLVGLTALTTTTTCTANLTHTLMQALRLD